MLVGDGNTHTRSQIHVRRFRLNAFVKGEFGFSVVQLVLAKNECVLVKCGHRWVTFGAKHDDLFCLHTNHMVIVCYPNNTYTFLWTFSQLNNWLWMRRRTLPFTVIMGGTFVFAAKLYVCVWTSAIRHYAECVRPELKKKCTIIGNTSLVFFPNWCEKRPHRVSVVCCVRWLYGEYGVGLGTV